MALHLRMLDSLDNIRTFRKSKIFLSFVANKGDVSRVNGLPHFLPSDVVPSEIVTGWAAVVQRPLSLEPCGEEQVGPVMLFVAGSRDLIVSLRSRIFVQSESETARCDFLNSRAARGMVTALQSARIITR